MEPPAGDSSGRAVTDLLAPSRDFVLDVHQKSARELKTDDIPTTGCNPAAARDLARPETGSQDAGDRGLRLGKYPK